VKLPGKTICLFYIALEIVIAIFCCSFYENDGSMKDHFYAGMIFLSDGHLDLSWREIGQIGCKKKEFFEAL